MKKRVLIFSTAYLPLIGGAEIAVKEITDRLPDYDFVLITAKLKKELQTEEWIGNVKVVRIGKGDRLDKLRLIWSGPETAIKLGSFDMIWSIMASYGGLAALKYKEKNKTIPLLLTLQEGDSMSRIYSKMIFCWRRFKRLFRFADRIQVISNYLGDWARSMGAKCPVDIVPNGVDIEKFRNQKINIKNGKTIITVSRLEKKNGIEDLIRAFIYLPEDYKLVVIGIGSLEAKLKRIAARLGLVDRVRFLGNIEHGDIPFYLWTSDVFCRPSLSEGLGNAFLEAMAAGLPVVATSVGGIPDFLKDRETGLFCRVNNSKDIAEKIKIIFEDNILRDNLIKNAKKIVEEKYNWTIISQEMSKIFAELIK